jgi:hypothetical protein
LHCLCFGFFPEMFLQVKLTAPAAFSTSRYASFLKLVGYKAVPQQVGHCDTAAAAADGHPLVDRSTAAAAAAASSIVISMSTARQHSKHAQQRSANA